MGLADRISAVTLACHDLGRMAAFYRQFGWPEAPSSVPEHVVFSITAAASSIPSTEPLGDSGPPGTPESAQLAITNFFWSLTRRMLTGTLVR